MRLRAGLVVLLSAICCGDQHSALADPIDEALAPRSAVTVPGEERRQRANSQRARIAVKANNLAPSLTPPLPVSKPRGSLTVRADRNKNTENGDEPATDVWQPDEIAAARFRCTALLKEIDAVVIPQPPLKESACGTPAPVRLVSLGMKTQVAFEPPALVNCDMVAALNNWITKHVQPIAKTHLGTRIIKVHVMSDYSCRKSFGRITSRFSEHAFANALDIRGFVTANGQTAYLLDDWGLTQRDLAAEAAAGKTQSDAAAQIAMKQTTASNYTTTRSGNVSGATHDLAAERLNEPQDTVLAQKAARAAKVAALTMQEQSRRASTKKARFLRDVHAAACEIFGTTLGPEANDAHRNHFHVDLAKRKYKKICD